MEAIDTAVRRIVEACGEPAVGDYAVIGNGKTLALLSRNGSLDWLCVPHFSAPSVFAGVLDAERGGRFVVHGRGLRSSTRRYLPGTPILCTEHVVEGGRLRTIDFMALPDTDEGMHCEHEIIRIAECIEGEVTLELLFQPRPDYARTSPRLSRRGKLGWHFAFGGVGSYLQTDVPLHANAVGDTLYGSRRLSAGERCVSVLAFDEGEPAVLTDITRADALLEQTGDWWREYSGRCTYHGPYREEVVRGRLTLKLLESCLTGAMVAAGTTSLPESFDGDRNWDYRYCWLRDSGQVIQSFTELGYADEAKLFLEWMLHATRLTRPYLQPVYDIFGEARIKEFTLDHLRGHRGHGTVRVGNAARKQTQLDVYGDVIIAACDYLKAGGRLDVHDRRLLADFGKVVCRHWREPDHGIWEIRKPKRHNTHTKLMCWAALNALLSVDALQSLEIDAGAVRAERDAIRADIDAHGFDPARGSYVACYDGDSADATLLLIPRLGYLPPEDPRVEATRRFVEEALGHNGMIYRYPTGGDYDGLDGIENPFGICSFWMVECLARMGRVDEAQARFERLLEHANDVGLYAEQLHAETGEPVANFPQAFTHVGLITAALELERAQQRRGGASP